jgi:AbrB family looped-hinge helix DNA binding protein
VFAAASWPDPWTGEAREKHATLVNRPPVCGQGKERGVVPACYATGRGRAFPLCRVLLFMNTISKIQNKGQVTIPPGVRRSAGLSKGDLVNFVYEHGKIVITPKLVADRSKSPGRRGRVHTGAACCD